MLYFFLSIISLCAVFLCLYVISKQKSVEENPISDCDTPQIIKYDVFVSFRGEDIRDGFLSHLLDTFQRKKINAFVDDKLERGDEIWSSLVGAIEGSFISLVIFSQDYASSRWCLEELMKILECREKYKQIVIPVFYHVEPKNVRHQLGSYKDSFSKHRREHKTKVQLWRLALNKSAALSGIESSKFQDDAELVKEIVNLLLKRLTKPPIKSKILVGIDEKIATVESWIRKESKDTCLIGIWGMGGIGKTTLAEEVFNKLQSEYEGSYFLAADERDQWNKHELKSLKEKIFSKLLEDDVKIDTPNSLPEDIIWRIGCKKVLIVLDDVNDSEHVEKLLGTPDNFGPDSRIIITTRDEQVLRANKVNKTYRLREFSFDKALELFNLNAFSKSDHQKEYNDLSKRVVDYAKGIPLVVKVLAGLLHGKNKEEWESMLDKLKKMPPTKVYDVMKLSYDGLDRKGQQIFLDLACFFLRTHVAVNVGNLKSLLKDNDSDNSVAFELGRLKDKALITFSEDNFVCMHDSVQEMAWEIVRQESIEDPGSRSRLWDPDDIYEAMKNDKVTEAIRSIRIQLPTVKQQKLMPHIFDKMSKLKFLEIFGEDNYDCYDQLILAEGTHFFAAELRFLHWYGYPLKSLPENFSAEKLVILKLPCSRVEKLWNGVKNLENLKELDLSYSEQLKELPDLSNATNLEVLLLCGCSMLIDVHSSIFSLGKLEKLDFGNCTSLTILASNSHLCSLTYLNLDTCENLMEFSLISENMKELRLGWTMVKELPSSFGNQRKLELLDLRGSGIERLPSFNNLTQLLRLNVSSCWALQTIAELPPFLDTLNANYCGSLQSLPKLPPSLKTLSVVSCKSLQSLPELPLSLETLNVQSCFSLQIIPNIPRSLKTLYVRFCSSLQTIAGLLPSLKTLDARYCKSLQSLPRLPQCLKTLNVEYCKSLQSLPELPQFLKTLDARNCASLESLPELPLSLETLNVTKCKSLKTVLLFPSMAVEQLKENRAQVLFWNCLNLDEHSLVAIGLNAQINVMKFANQLLSAPNRHHVENYKPYDHLNRHSYQVVYVYPGSSVPEWLEYKTTKDYIIIDLSSAPASPVLGFIFCFVLGKYRHIDIIRRLAFNITITISDGEGEGIKDSVRMYIDCWDYTIKSDHVCVVYNQRCSSFLNSKAKNYTRFTIGVQTYCAATHTQPQQVLKGFGVNLIGTSTYNSFIQLMELRDSMSQFH